MFNITNKIKKMFNIFIISGLQNIKGNNKTNKITIKQSSKLLINLHLFNSNNVNIEIKDKIK